MADSVSFFNYFTTSNPALDEELAQFLFEDFWRRAFDYYQGVRSGWGGTSRSYANSH